MNSTISLLSKSKISSLKPSSVTVQPGLCQTWSETQIVVCCFFFHAHAHVMNTPNAFSVHISSDQGNGCICHIKALTTFHLGIFFTTEESHIK